MPVESWNDKDRLGGPNARVGLTTVAGSSALAKLQQQLDFAANTTLARWRIAAHHLITSTPGLPDVLVDEVSEQIELLLGQRSTQGRRAEAVLAGCLVWACRNRGITISLQAGADLAGCNNSSAAAAVIDALKEYHYQRETVKLNRAVADPCPNEAPGSTGVRMPGASAFAAPGPHNLAGVTAAPAPANSAAPPTPGAPQQVPQRPVATAASRSQAYTAVVPLIKQLCLQFAVPPALSAAALSQAELICQTLEGCRPHTVGAAAVLLAAEQGVNHEAANKVPLASLAAAVGLTAATLKKARGRLQKAGIMLTLAPSASGSNGVISAALVGSANPEFSGPSSTGGAREGGKTRGRYIAESPLQATCTDVTADAAQPAAKEVKLRSGSSHSEASLQSEQSNAAGQLLSSGDSEQGSDMLHCALAAMEALSGDQELLMLDDVLSCMG